MSHVLWYWKNGTNLQTASFVLLNEAKWLFDLLRDSGKCSAGSLTTEVGGKTVVLEGFNQ